MNDAPYKPGRRSLADRRPALKFVAVKLDEEAALALEALERALVGSRVRGKTSVVLRKLILDAHSKLIKQG